MANMQMQNAKCKKAKWKMQINLHSAYKAGSLARLAPVLSCCCWCCHSALFECLFNTLRLDLCVWVYHYEAVVTFVLVLEIWSSNWFSICAPQQPLRLAANGYKSIHTLPRIAPQTDREIRDLTVVWGFFCFICKFYWKMSTGVAAVDNCRGNARCMRTESQSLSLHIIKIII